MQERTARPVRVSALQKTLKMADHKTHVNEAIEALGQYLGCPAANRMIGWSEECLRDLQHQSRKGDDCRDALPGLGCDREHIPTWKSRPMTDGSRPDPSPAKYPGEPGSRADIDRRQFLRDELAYRARLTAELERA